jgi:hypothetical protein
MLSTGKECGIESGSLEFVTKFNRHSGQAGDSWRDPESRKFKGFWIPAFAGMTDSDAGLCKRTLIPGH